MGQGESKGWTGLEPEWRFLTIWDKEGSFWIPVIFKDPSHNVVLEIIYSPGNARVHKSPDGSHSIYNLTASSGARWEKSIPQPPRARLTESWETWHRSQWTRQVIPEAPGAWDGF